MNIPPSIPAATTTHAQAAKSSQERRSGANKTELKARVDAREFYLSVMGSGKRSGKALLDHVPWRVDRHPSLNVYEDGWWDRANDDHGDIFDLAQRLYKCNFYRAVEYVAAWYGADPAGQRPARLPHHHQEAASAEPPSPAKQQEARQIIERGIRALWSPDGNTGIDDLHQRGLTDDAAHAVSLGYASADMMDELFWDYEHNCPKYSRSAAIIIPWMHGSTIWGVKFRRLTPADGETRFVQLGGMNLAGTLYSVGPIRPDKPTFFVEGEMKAIKCYQEAGDLANFVTTGSARNRIHKRFLSLLGSYAGCFQVPDQDSTGRQAALANALGLPDGYIIATVPQTLGYAKALDDFAALGGDIRAFVLETLRNATPEPPNGGWHGSVPISYRAALHLYTPDSVAPYLELRCEAIALGWTTANQELTIAELLDLAVRTGREVSEWTLRRGATLLAKYLAVLPPEDPIQSEIEDSIVGKTAKQPSRAKTYLMPSCEQVRDLLLALSAKRLLEAAFLDEDPTVAPIVELLDDVPDLAIALEEKYRMQITSQPDLRGKLDQVQRAYRRIAWRLADQTTAAMPFGWKYRNRTEYTACCARAIKMASPNEDLSHQQWATLLGISPRLVSRVLKAAGIRSTPVFVEVPVRSLVQVRQLGYTMRAFPRQIVTTDGRTFVYCPEALEDEVIRRGQVTVRFQKVNHQELEGDAQPAPLPVTRVQSGQTARSGHNKTIVSRSSSTPRASYYGLDHDPVWRENGRLKLLSRVTPWTKQGNMLLDRATGILVPYSSQAVIDRLLAASTDSSELTGDTLLDMVVVGLGGRIVSVECSRVVLEEEASEGISSGSCRCDLVGSG